MARPQNDVRKPAYRSKPVLAGFLARCIGASDGIAASETPFEDAGVFPFRLIEQGNENYPLSSKTGVSTTDLPVARFWLIPPAEKAAEQADYVTSSAYNQETTTFRIHSGWLGIRLSSYAVQDKGSAGAAAGRDVFLVYHERSGVLLPGLVELSVTKARVRQMGCWSAFQTRFQLSDVNGVGAADIGVVREALRCTEVATANGEVEGVFKPCFAKVPTEWHLFVDGRWRATASQGAIVPAGQARQLPWIGITKGPMDFVLEVMPPHRHPLQRATVESPVADRSDQPCDRSRPRAELNQCLAGRFASRRAFM